jgi:3-oxoadipate enol-lactonase
MQQLLRTLAAPAERAMGTNTYADVVGAGIHLEAGTRRVLERAIAPGLRACNLATNADLVYVQKRMAALDRRLDPKSARVRRLRSSRPHWHDGGAGPTVVLVNGWGASGLTWPSAWLNRLDRYFRVIRPDNRGTGRSRRAQTPFTIADLAKDVLAILDEAAVERAVIVGLSMGGMIAQELALRAPSRVAALVLVATRPSVPAHRPTLRSSVAWELLRPPHPRGALEAYTRRQWVLTTAPDFPERHPEVIDQIVHQTMARLTPRLLLLQQARAIFGWGHSERLRRIEAPTTIVHGRLDPLVEVENGQTLARLIPHSRYIELADVGHLVPYEATERLHDIVAEIARPSTTAEAV